MTEFEVQRRGRWWWLRQAVMNQEFGQVQEYDVSGEIRLASMALHDTAKKEKFSVKIANSGQGHIVVLKKKGKK